MKHIRVAVILLGVVLPLVGPRYLAALPCEDYSGTTVPFTTAYAPVAPTAAAGGDSLLAVAGEGDVLLYAFPGPGAGPELRGRLGLGADAHALAFAGRWLAAARGDSEVVVIDTLDPANPVMAQELVFPDGIAAMCSWTREGVPGLVTVSAGGVCTLLQEQPGGGLAVLGSVATGDSLRSVVCREDAAFAGGPHVLVCLDLADPAVPTVASVVDWSPSSNPYTDCRPDIRDMTLVNGDRLVVQGYMCWSYCCEGWCDRCCLLTSLAVANPSTPAYDHTWIREMGGNRLASVGDRAFRLSGGWIAELDVGGGATRDDVVRDERTFEDLVACGSRVCAVEADGRIHGLDLRQGEVIEPVTYETSYWDPDDGHDIRCDASSVYCEVWREEIVGQGYYALSYQFIDVSNPLHPRKYGYYDLGDAQGHPEPRLTVLDRTPAKICLYTESSVPWHFTGVRLHSIDRWPEGGFRVADAPQQAVIAGDMLWLRHGAQMFGYDTTIPPDQEPVSFSLPVDAQVQRVGDARGIVRPNDDGAEVLLLDLASRQGPWLAGTFQIPSGNVVWAQAGDHVLAKLRGPDEILVVDAGDPFAPAVVGSLACAGVLDLAATDPHHALLVDDRAVSVVSLADPTNPVWLFQDRSLEVTPYSVVLHYPLAYVRSDKVYVFDLSRADGPVVVGTARTPGGDLVPRGDCLKGRGWVLPYACGDALPIDPPPGEQPPPSSRHLLLATPTPNPFNPRTELRFDLPRPGRVTVAVYDVAGHLVRTLVDGRRSAGRHAVTWDGRDAAGREVPAGVYFARLAADGRTEVRKLALVR